MSKHIELVTKLREIFQIDRTNHNTPTVLTQAAEEGGTTRTQKLRQIEHEFLECTFSMEDV